MKHTVIVQYENQQVAEQALAALQEQGVLQVLNEIHQELHDKQKGLVDSLLELQGMWEDLDIDARQLREMAWRRKPLW
jgi:hypothetical protein